MRIANLLTPQGPRACVRGTDRYLDLAACDPALPNDTRAFLAQGPDALARAEAVRRSGTVGYPIDGAQLLAPITDPNKVICLGLNYRDHAIESKMPIPEEPVLFNKFPSAIVGPLADILLPKVSQQVDYEAELVVVIGRRGRDIPESSAMDYVAGYTVGHDVSARDWQLNKPGKQWLAGKTFDTFAPIGPELVTKDEVPDPHELQISLRHNGIVRQNSNTRELIFRIESVIAYLSQICTLFPGDLIFTGTPPGVGMAQNPQVWLQPGDVVEVEIEKLGVLRNTCKAR